MKLTDKLTEKIDVSGVTLPGNVFGNPVQSTGSRISPELFLTKQELVRHYINAKEQLESYRKAVENLENLINGEDQF